MVCEGTGHLGTDPHITSQALVRRLTHRLRQTIETKNGVLSVGVSVGVAIGGGETTAATLLSQADEAMYEVKRASRSSATRGASTEEVGAFS